MAFPRLASHQDDTRRWLSLSMLINDINRGLEASALILTVLFCTFNQTLNTVLMSSCFKLQLRSIFILHRLMFGCFNDAKAHLKSRPLCC